MNWLLVNNSNFRKMKKLFNVFVLVFVVASISLLNSCGGKAEPSEKTKLIMSTAWKLSINEVIEDATTQVDSATGITADISLQGDVGALANFLAETLTLGEDANDDTKMVYEQKIGEGMLSMSVTGWWKWNEDETALIFEEWDAQAEAAKAPVTYKVQELTAEKLVLLKEGDTVPKIYNAK